MYDIACSSAPIRKDDEVTVTRGRFKGQAGKVTQVW
jgi:ribosomal protein L24